ncbi:MAG: type II-A CRISPR-associated protein Csn2 [Candidatus Saccharibacteria bacterium]|nr:type II-A CRISPR-associated protein Csn2 [Candidatus Saccharibacteria bacterium]
MIRNIEYPLVFREDMVTTLQIQHRHLFREVLSELARSQVEYIDRRIVTFDDGVSVGDRIVLVSDVLSFDFSNRKLLAELYRKIIESRDDDIVKLLSVMETELEKLAVFAERAAEIDLDYKSGIEMSDWLKLLKLQPLVKGVYDPKKRAYGIIDVVSRLFTGRIICFVGLKQLLTYDEYVELVKYCLYKKQLVWFLEPSETYLSNLEEIVVVDEDLFCSKPTL